MHCYVLRAGAQNMFYVEFLKKYLVSGRPCASLFKFKIMITVSFFCAGLQLTLVSSFKQIFLDLDQLFRCYALIESSILFMSLIYV